MSSLTKDYGSWGTSLDIMNPELIKLVTDNGEIIVIIIIIILSAYSIIKLFKKSED